MSRASFVHGLRGGLRCITLVYWVLILCKRPLTEHIASQVLPGQVVIALLNHICKATFPWECMAEAAEGSRIRPRSSTEAQGKPGADFLSFPSGVAATLSPSLAVTFLFQFFTDCVWGIHTEQPLRRARPWRHPAGHRHPAGELHGYVSWELRMHGWGWRVFACRLPVDHISPAWEFLDLT